MFYYILCGTDGSSSGASWRHHRRLFTKSRYGRVLNLGTIEYSRILLNLAATAFVRPYRYMYLSLASYVPYFVTIRVSWCQPLTPQVGIHGTAYAFLASAAGYVGYVGLGGIKRVRLEFLVVRPAGDYSRKEKN
eukprot:SAG31_NODE_325_length_17671_cov_9.902743_16_plen_134_part_00